ncbi:LysR family transcriptional regulator [Ectobacillus sp. sgz5001026]|uniref:LysR family transcriptional regulator n=1 Tax=Ectobacillus sp. sgz5001026 TaxID=3242473 RepID=UPI0036D42CDD
MELRLLQYALEVYRKRSFTKAAVSLHIAQPSLSQQIRKLEEEIGVCLFYRGHGPVVLTPEGIRFIEKAEQIIRAHDDLLREMHESNEGVGSELTIGVPAVTGGHVLPPLIQAYLERYPQVKVHLIEESTEELEHLTVRGIVDLSVLPLPIESNRLVTRSMLTETLLLAIPREEKNWMSEEVRFIVNSVDENVQVAEKMLPLAAVNESPFILLKQGFGFRRVVLDLCAESGFQPQVAFMTSNIETAQSLVASGLGVTIVPKMVMRQNLKLNPLYVPLDSHPTRTLVFTYLGERYLSLTARTFMDVFDEVFGDLGI